MWLKSGFMIKFLFFWLLWCVYSFTRQDLNLTWYHQLTVPLQTLGWYQRPLVTAIFVILCLLFFGIYFLLLRKNWQFSCLLGVGLLGIFSYPLFSYDIFNYLFNAKMVWIYHANPHLQTAIEFSRDPLLRFMQNVHTSAPYAYGWTVLSLLPGLVWFTGKFTLAFWAMKVFISAFWLGQLWILKKLVNKLFPQEQWRFWLFALNPLVLVETLINGHNDVAMMFFALVSYWLLLQSKKVKAILLLLLSAAIKYVTIILLPLYFLPRRFFPIFASLLLTAVMFVRPEQLHSWYLIWAFSLAVLAKPKWLVAVVTALTFGALLRYAPYIYYGNWDPPVYLIRNLIWIGSLALVPLIRKTVLK
jgi:hypothetical protein